MKFNNEKKFNRILHTLLPTAALGIGVSVPATVVHAAIATPDEIVVTARRTEEVTQNVPIAMTVFNQEMLTERNVTTGADLRSYTPSLSVDTRFGPDQASFALRGFTQEFRTTASVAVYFADVVAPRGGGNVTAGDGAGPGAFFDLQNVQVLKGPQGTLFGRNTTGGAIQLVPQEPTSKLEGYVEASAGNYNMRRFQGVINVPLTDNARARFGLDKMTRDGYLDNTTDIGPSHFADVDYLAGRASLIVDIGSSVENYTIFTYTDSENNGILRQLFACNTGQTSGLGPLFASMCTRALAAQGDDFYAVANTTSDPISKLKQWQGINTTTWDVNDNLTIKNIISYADLEQTMRTSVYGSNYRFIAGGGAVNLYPFSFATSWQYPGLPTNSQTTFVEELQASGSALDDDLTWQAGLYFENSRPDGWSGAQSPGFIACGVDSLGLDPASWNCFNPLPLGSVQRNTAKVEFINKAIYSQATYNFSDEFRATLGLRYTVDETQADSKYINYVGNSGITFLRTPVCANESASLSNDCLAKADTKSEAPTWLIDFDYLPTPDILIYAKYARGYRQGSIVVAAPAGYQEYDPEEVDAYEIGAKTTFYGPIPGTFNIAAFYNELSDQQLQLGLTPSLNPAAATTAIVNAGKSKIQGIEVETTLKLLEDLTVGLAYTYLETRLDSVEYPNVPGYTLSPAATEGEHLTYSPRHNAVLNLNYQLPLPKEVGDITAGLSYTFTSKQNATSTDPVIGSPYGEMSSHRLLNASLSWKAIFGSPFDASLFATNIRDEEYHVFTAGLYNKIASEYALPGEPRMYGARVKYNF